MVNIKQQTKAIRLLPIWMGCKISMGEINIWGGKQVRENREYPTQHYSEMTQCFQVKLIGLKGIFQNQDLVSICK